MGLLKEAWTWMPHPAHLIVARDCRFHLATHVGGYIVSTVGEWWPDSMVRDILAQCRGITLEGKGDAREADAMKKLGYQEIGAGRLYETMVFRAIPRVSDDPSDQCCPFVVSDHTELAFAGSNDPAEAMANHMRLCEEWALEGDALYVSVMREREG